MNQLRTFDQIVQEYKTSLQREIAEEQRLKAEQQARIDAEINRLRAWFPGWMESNHAVSMAGVEFQVVKDGDSNIDRRYTITVSLGGSVFLSPLYSFYLIDGQGVGWEARRKDSYKWSVFVQGRSDRWVYTTVDEAAYRAREELALLAEPMF
jgi:hypothetical protein